MGSCIYTTQFQEKRPPSAHLINSSLLITSSLISPAVIISQPITLQSPQYKYTCEPSPACSHYQRGREHSLHPPLLPPSPRLPAPTLPVISPGTRGSTGAKTTDLRASIHRRLLQRLLPHPESHPPGFPSSTSFIQ